MPYGGRKIWYGIIPTRFTPCVKLCSLEGAVTLKVAHECPMRTLPSELYYLCSKAFSGSLVDANREGDSSMHSRDSAAHEGLIVLCLGCKSLASLTAQCECDNSPTNPFEEP